MKASPEQQQILLDLQAADRRIAQLKTIRKKHPVVATLDELGARRDDLERALIGARSKEKDVDRDVKQVEHDLERLEARQDSMQGRLDAGKGTSKDLMAMQHELNQMAKRRGELETTVIQVMEKRERAHEAVTKLEDQMNQVGADQAKAREELGTAMSDVEAELEEKTQLRTKLAGELDDELSEEYEYCRSRTGGIGVMEAKGRSIVGMTVQLSEMEWHEINMLPADEVFLSEELECIVVKTE
ncbi:hypothetical protein QS713_07460 [Gleimia hominis]|uniref:CT398-like coiled coil hairpin domain-containing protein n=1 Tax=Gleimia hominis TaxID=595468 RepID=A0ABU3IBZ3_9ACTO|nr:hypothetical protein [Gleimia hominis]MDT3767895.1 hypothetical protein [Gleimia hominis]